MWRLIETPDKPHTGLATPPLRLANGAGAAANGGALHPMAMMNGGSGAARVEDRPTTSCCSASASAARVVEAEGGERFVSQMGQMEARLMQSFQALAARQDEQLRTMIDLRGDVAKLQSAVALATAVGDLASGGGGSGTALAIIPSSSASCTTRSGSPAFGRSSMTPSPGPSRPSSARRGSASWDAASSGAESDGGDSQAGSPPGRSLARQATGVFGSDEGRCVEPPHGPPPSWTPAY